MSIVYGGGAYLNFMEKTLKFVKVFSLQVFRYVGIVTIVTSITFLVKIPEAVQAHTTDYCRQVVLEVNMNK